MDGSPPGHHFEGILYHKVEKTDQEGGPHVPKELTVHPVPLEDGLQLSTLVVREYLQVVGHTVEQVGDHGVLDELEDVGVL